MHFFHANKHYKFDKLSDIGLLPVNCTWYLHPHSFSFVQSFACNFHCCCIYRIRCKTFILCFLWFSPLFFKYFDFSNPRFFELFCWSPESSKNRGSTVFSKFSKFVRKFFRRNFSFVMYVAMYFLKTCISWFLRALSSKCSHKRCWFYVCMLNQSHFIVPNVEQ